jgi:hypothetical protein
MAPERLRHGRRPSTGPGALCATCKAPIVWAVTDHGRRMPVDLEPVPRTLFAEARDGNLVLWFQVDELDRATGPQCVSYATDDQRRNPDVPLWRAHFSTCPTVHAARRDRR